MKLQNLTIFERYRVRIMILLGIVCIAYMMYKLSDPAIIFNQPLYWLLFLSFIFTFLTILYEWYHYWDIRVPANQEPLQKYTVDIFTTYCAGEPYPMIVETLQAIQKITYPHTAYLCDEADDAYLKKICSELGVVHVTRSDKSNAKAGNINNALKYSSGELCVVLDPDHVPQPDFLDPIVGHFNNPDIGFVQIVQAYSNFDESLIAKGAAQQTFQFYGPMMMTMNAYGTVLAIGANCTFRRIALESIGGHSAGLAEDMNTAMHLHARGWKSVYVPEVLSRGLVPAKLSAYYKQQLKWSRGVFELWVTSFIQLFRKFSFRQKIHYFTIPLFYFSGFVVLINFLIPVLSLFFHIYPLRFDFTDFLIISMPILAAIILIRLFVQHWVMEDKERGFHVVGGLLFIGTWWVFILGFIYTVIRKKVPYLPTPKDSKTENNFWISLPNILMLILSVTAIIYGLHTDWNPYTIIMSGMAGINCLILLFVLYAGEQLKIRDYSKKYKIFAELLLVIKFWKGKLWLARRWSYKHFRQISLTLLLLIFGFVFYQIFLDNDDTDIPVTKSVSQNFYIGFPVTDSFTMHSFELIQHFQKKYKVHADILSNSIPFDTTKQLMIIDTVQMHAVYSNQSIPYINWILSTSKKSDLFIKTILAGKQDTYIRHFAQSIGQLNRPVYLSFNTADENSFKNTDGNNFKRVWIHLHDLFKESHIYNVIWVLNRPSPESLNNDFPGKDYVDEVILPLKCSEHTNADSTRILLDNLIANYQNSTIAKLGIPVFLAITGKSDTATISWLNNQKNIKLWQLQLPDFNGILMMDNNVLPELLASHNCLNGNLFQSNRNNLIPSPIGLDLLTTVNRNTGIASKKYFENIRGVNYTKGEFWYKNRYPLTSKEIVRDFNEMKSLGINAIKINGPNIYDKLILETAKETGLRIHYSFWVPEFLDFIKDKNKLNQLSSSILNFITLNRNNKSIISWNISNAVFQNLSAYYSKPALYYQQQAYLVWLNRLVETIQKKDKERPVSIDVDVTNTMEEAICQLRLIRGIDAYGLIIPQKNFDPVTLNNLQFPFFISETGVAEYLKIKDFVSGVFINNWQDQESANQVTINGLKDFTGRYKQSYFQLKALWSGMGDVPAFPAIKILIPALTTDYKAVLPYHVLVQKDHQWKIADSSDTSIQYEWYLIKTDHVSDNSISIKTLGKGPSLLLEIPADASSYKLFLIAIKGKAIITNESNLNLPLNSVFAR